MKNADRFQTKLIVEAATKKPMHQLLREDIFSPLKLKDTYVQIAEKELFSQQHPVLTVLLMDL